MTTIKDEYNEAMTLAEAEKLTIKTLKQVMEEKMSTDNVELCVIPASTCKLIHRDAAYIQGLMNAL